ncbi:MAG: dockerin type I repeat-containing protein [Ruminococcus sp.]|nr:dockerin type I repeat-containing protein [Ruminococcus sp.]
MNNRYYFLVPDGSNGIPKKEGGYASSWHTDNASILFYAISNNDERIIEAERSDDEDVYYVDVDVDFTLGFWSNGYNPTVSTVNIQLEYYDAGESALYPDGLESFNEMIYVVDPNVLIISSRYQLQGEWYYYYGNGCYGVTKNGNVNECLRDDHNHYDIGDSNVDGVVNVMDATTIQRHLAQLNWISEENFYLADVDKDSIISIIDATIIQRFVAGMIKEM